MGAGGYPARRDGTASGANQAGCPASGGAAAVASQAMEGTRPSRWLALVLLVGPLVGCAKDLLWRDGRAVHPELGFSVAAPADTQLWQPIVVDGSWLAYRHESGSHMSLQTRCFRRFLNAQLRARHLLIGVEPRELRQSGPVAVGAIGGWSQVVDVGGRAPVRVKTVTLLVEECAYDWVLTSRDDFDALEPSFDAWWQSFARERDPGAS